jgi:hypothetical protein
MGSWILVAVLYLIGIGFFRWVGGIGAAAEALQRWGHASAARRKAGGSPASPST